MIIRANIPQAVAKQILQSKRRKRRKAQQTKEIMRLRKIGVHTRTLRIANLMDALRKSIETGKDVP
jgi:hypothetical protein